MFFAAKKAVAVWRIQVLHTFHWVQLREIDKPSASRLGVCAGHLTIIRGSCDCPYDVCFALHREQIAWEHIQAFPTVFPIEAVSIVLSISTIQGGRVEV